MISGAWSTVLIIICALQTKVNSYNEADRISSLPGQPKIDFQQYSGYITVNDDEKQERSYFYYFVEAETEPASKPLVLWLNGGPGCSSFGIGAFNENGPFQPSENVLVRNNNSWNKVANMIYLESPAGVGFSFSVDKSFYQSVDDEITASDNLIFLEKWLEKFPEFNNREFYITGESYGGHYIPQLANLIVQSKPKLLLSLKGIAIGNPLLDFNTDFNSVSGYWWSHGLISDSTFDEFTFVCNYSQIRRQYDDDKKLTAECSKVMNQASSEISGSVDPYDVTLDVCSPPAASQQSQILSQMQNEPKVDVCLQDETNVYLNRKDVQKALHARLVGVTKWKECSTVVQYKMQDLETPMSSILGSLVKTGIRVLVYSGDQDSVIPFTGTRKLVNVLAEKQLKWNTTRPYRAWLLSEQVAGWMQVYGHLLTFATIRGAGHETPLTQPERSLHLFTSFLNGTF